MSTRYDKTTHEGDNAAEAVRMALAEAAIVWEANAPTRDANERITQANAPIRAHNARVDEVNALIRARNSRIRDKYPYDPKRKLLYWRCVQRAELARKLNNRFHISSASEQALRNRAECQAAMLTKTPNRWLYDVLDATPDEGERNRLASIVWWDWVDSCHGLSDTLLSFVDAREQPDIDVPRMAHLLEMAGFHPYDARIRATPSRALSKTTSPGHKRFGAVSRRSEAGQL